MIHRGLLSRRLNVALQDLTLNPDANVTANILPGLGIDEYLTRTDTAGARTLLTDALGSTLALTDDAGIMQTNYTYEPFGNTTAAGATTANSFQYTGRENDDTGLYYYRARYYHPRLQRFVSPDPIDFTGGDMNLYAYVRNNPFNYIDPFGYTSFGPGRFGIPPTRPYVAPRGGNPYRPTPPKDIGPKPGQPGEPPQRFPEPPDRPDIHDHPPDFPAPQCLDPGICFVSPGLGSGPPVLTPPIGGRPGGSPPLGGRKDPPGAPPGSKDPPWQPPWWDQCVSSGECL